MPTHGDLSGYIRPQPREREHMPNKKAPGRFTISLNLENPIQREVAQAINRQEPRWKTQFIVNAISHYIHCPETSVASTAGGGGTSDHATIEAVILQIWVEKGLLPDRQMPMPPARPTAIPAEQEREARRQAEELIGEKGLSAMHHTMAAFRRC